MVNYYTILEVGNFAPAETVKKAHRRLSMQYHPDRNNGDKLCEEKFKAIQNAYEKLSDPYTKQLHDDLLNGNFTFTERTSDTHYTYTQPEPAETVFNQKKKSNSYVPWGFIIMIILWVMRAMVSSTDGPQINYDNAVYQSKVTTGETDPVMQLLTGIDSTQANAGNNTSANTAAPVFTIGSSKKDVVQAQGYPNSAQFLGINNREKWYYNKSSVTFESGFVIAYLNEDSNLNIAMMPSIAFNKKDSDSLFSIGSTKDQVLFIQHVPVSITKAVNSNEEMWFYGAGIVTFKNGMVSSFMNNGGLHVK